MTPPHTVRPKNRPAADAGVLLHEDEDAPERHARLGEPHVAPLMTLVARIADETGEHVPAVDPESGGVDSRILVLRRDPRCSAVRGPAMTSVHRDDPASGNLLVCLEAAGLTVGDVLFWHVVPWWIDDPARSDGARRSPAQQARRAAPYLAAIVALLPRLRAVVLLGRDTEQAWARAVGAQALPADVVVFTAPHPSPLAWNTREPDGTPRRERTKAAFAHAAVATR